VMRERSSMWLEMSPLPRSVLSTAWHLHDEDRLPRRNAWQLFAM
jgi:hypothetical protein